MIYYFILGRENKISQKEVEAVLASFGVDISEADIRRNSQSEVESISILSDQVLEIKLDASADKIADLMKILGGTVKIYQKVAASLENIDKVIFDCPEKKIIFGISNYSKSKIDTFRIALEIKKRLGKKRSIRVIAGKDSDKLSSAQSYQYRLDCRGVELGFFDAGVGKLIAVQNIDDWTRRDYGKPRSDARSGMLPPKLARAMVNLAIGQAITKKQDTNSKQIRNSKLEIRNCDDFVVVDPFCGSGNVLIEALSLGCDVIGSDISQKAVDDTKANIKWLMSKSEIRNPKQISNPKFQISKQDATKFDFGQIKRDFVIVTEPYLGRPRSHKLTIEEEKETLSGASKLYLDFLSNLKLAGLRLKAIVIVFPLLELANGKKLSIFEECIDKIKKIGYALICPPMVYGRDYQIVKRQIVLLKLT